MSRIIYLEQGLVVALRVDQPLRSIHKSMSACCDGPAYSPGEAREGLRWRHPDYGSDCGLGVSLTQDT